MNDALLNTVASAAGAVVPASSPPDGFPVADELLARLFPLQYDHIKFLGRYAFTRPAAPGLRPLCDPHVHDESDDGEAE